MCPPPKKEKTKGAPKKVECFIRSTKRSPSLQEYVDAHDTNTHVSKLKTTYSSRKGLCASNKYHNRPPIYVDFPHKKKISSFMHQFTVKVVKAEGMVIVDFVLLQAYMICLLMIIILPILIF